VESGPYPVFLECGFGGGVRGSGPYPVFLERGFGGGALFTLKWFSVYAKSVLLHKK
jgi:hypothetical protein